MYSLGLIHLNAFTWLHSFNYICLVAFILWHKPACNPLIIFPRFIKLVSFTCLHSLVCIHLVAFTWLHSLGCIHWLHSLGCIHLVAFTGMHSLGFIPLGTYIWLQSHCYIHLVAIPYLYSFICSYPILLWIFLWPAYFHVFKNVVKIDVRPSLKREGYIIITKIIFENDLRSFRLPLSFESSLYFTLYLMIAKDVNIVK